jgi:hypothetical protein
MSGAFGGLAGGGAFGSGGSSQPKHHGLLHDIVHAPAEFTGHLLGDVRDMAVGLPEGFAMLATHPERRSSRSARRPGTTGRRCSTATSASSGTTSWRTRSRRSSTSPVSSPAARGSLARGGKALGLRR